MEFVRRHDMERLTKLSVNNEYYIVDDITVRHGDEGCYGDAIEKLAKFEDLYDYLIESQRTIPEELEKLRNDDKIKSYKFKELMAQKLTNDAFLMLLGRYGLK